MFDQYPPSLPPLALRRLDEPLLPGFVLQGWLSKWLTGDDTWYFYAEHYNLTTNKMEWTSTPLTCLSYANRKINLGIVVGTAGYKTPFRAGKCTREL